MAISTSIYWSKTPLSPLTIYKPMVSTSANLRSYTSKILLIRDTVFNWKISTYKNRYVKCLNNYRTVRTTVLTDLVSDMFHCDDSTPVCATLASTAAACACISITMSVYSYGSAATVQNTSSRNLRSESACPSCVWLSRSWINHASTS